MLLRFTEYDSTIGNFGIYRKCGPVWRHGALYRTIPPEGHETPPAEIAKNLSSTRRVADRGPRMLAGECMWKSRRSYGLHTLPRGGRPRARLNSASCARWRADQISVLEKRRPRIVLSSEIMLLRIALCSTAPQSFECSSAHNRHLGTLNAHQSHAAAGGTASQQTMTSGRQVSGTPSMGTFGG